MRELKNEDFYMISEIVNKMDVKTPRYFIQEGNKTIKKQQEEWGAEFALVLFKNMYKAKREINKLLASVLEKDIKEVEKMSIKETIQYAKELFAKEGFIDFFK